MPLKTDALAETLREVLVSPNVMDSNGEPANLVDAMSNLARSLWHGLGYRDNPRDRPNAIEGHGEAIKAAAETIAEAIHDLASAVRERT